MWLFLTFRHLDNPWNNEQAYGDYIVTLKKDCSELSRYHNLLQ